MTKKVQIKDIRGNVIFEYEKENNTIKDTLEEGVRQGISFSRSDLRYADLSEADLRGADLRGADIRYADLRGADLSYANLSGAMLSKANLREADICFANLRESYLSGADLRGANLSFVNLHGADLSEADLSGANLSFVNLHGADLSEADLSGANLRYADLCYANISMASLNGANISEAKICWASLSGTDLSGTDLLGADLYNAYINEAKNIPYIPMACPSEGAFIGWKKVNGCLIQLEIPEDAKRSSATTNKCRCSKAKVLSITDLDGNNHINEIVNDNYVPYVTYKVGEMVYPDSFDGVRWNECSHGIHFFIDKEEAMNYNFP